ncbi:MAG: T9SS type A sorting domain-containing protein [Bacteroidia bacterium]
MKEYTLIFLVTIFTSAFAQSWQWTSSENYDSYVTRPNAIVNDINGNSYIASLSYSTGVHIVKYNSLGTKLWEKVYNGGAVGLTSLCTDSAANLYAVFWATNVEGVTYNPSHGAVLFAKYDANGNLIWIKQITYRLLLSERTNFKGELVGDGTYTDTLHLENGYTLTITPGDYKYFMIKYNTDGECIWAQQDDGGRFQPVINSKGDSFAWADMLLYPVTVGQDSNQVALSPADGDEYFAKYDSTGALIWVKQPNASLIAGDNFGNAYIFEADPAQYGAAFITKYDPNGSRLWQRTRIYTSDWYKAQMKCSAGGDLFLAGGFSNSLTIDDTIITASGTHAFVAKIDSSGVLQWVTISGGTGNAGAKDISIGDDGAIYITGDMGGTVCFGPHCTTQASGVFAAKLLDVPSSAATSIAGQVNDNALSVFPNPNGGVFILQYKDVKASSLMLEIRNSHGQLVFHSSEKCSNGVLMKNIDLSKEPKGIYFLRVSGRGKNSVRKIVLN